MKNIILIFALLIATNSNVFADDKELTKEAKLINEVIKSLEEVEIEDFNFGKTIDIYTPEGKLLYSFLEENVDPKALRNADLLLEDDMKKIFIKYRN
ncbi:hypothetical protein [Marivirga lumbricoides]